MRTFKTVAVSMRPEMLEQLRRVARLQDLTVSRLVTWCIRYALHNAMRADVGMIDLSQVRRSIEVGGVDSADSEIDT